MTETIEDVCADEPEAVAWVIERLTAEAMEIRTRTTIADGSGQMTPEELVEGSLATTLAIVCTTALQRRVDDLANARACLLELVQRMGDVTPPLIFDTRDHLLAAPGESPPARVYRALGVEIGAAVEACLRIGLAASE